MQDFVISAIANLTRRIQRLEERLDSRVIDEQTRVTSGPLTPPTRGPGSQPHTSRFIQTDPAPTPAPPPNPSGVSPSSTLLDDLLNTLFNFSSEAGPEVWIHGQGWVKREQVIKIIKPILDRWNTSATATYDPSLGSLPQQLRDTRAQLDTALRELALLRELLAIRS